MMSKDASYRLVSKSGSGCRLKWKSLLFWIYSIVCRWNMHSRMRVNSVYYAKISNATSLVVY